MVRAGAAEFEMLNASRADYCDEERATAINRTLHLHLRCFSAAISFLHRTSGSFFMGVDRSAPISWRGFDNNEHRPQTAACA